MSNPATPKQRAFVDRLVAERQVPVAGRTSEEAWLIARVEDLGEVGEDARFVSTSEASRVIDWLLTLARPAAVASIATEPRRETPAVTEAGFYLLGDDVVVKVRQSRSTGRFYAESLVVEGYGSARWEYERGVIFRLSPEAKLTAEQAAELGHRWGVCVLCAAELDDPESVEAGIGPVCVRKLGKTRKQVIAARQAVSA